MRFSYQCNECDRVYASEEVFYTCPQCSNTEEKGEFRKGNVIVNFNADYLQELKKEKHFPLQELFPYPVPYRAAFPVGPTPLAKPFRLAKKYGLQHLLFKLDNLLPSGSYKDRASQMVAAQAIHHGEKRIALASTGNAGAAMSCAGAAYGLEIVLFVPESAPVNKLMQSILYGATVVPVKGSYDDAFALSLYYSQQYGGINRNTAYNPMTVEGKKSVAFEIFLQLKGDLPDIIYVPVGDGCIYAGVCKGFLDLKRSGLITKVPQIVCVQSEKSAAIAQAWESGIPATVEATTSPIQSVSPLRLMGGWCCAISKRHRGGPPLSLMKRS